MNVSLLSRFTPEILGGAKSCDLSPRSLARILGVNREGLTKLTSGSVKLNPRQARSLETETARSLGELVVLGIAQAASPQKRAKNAELLRSTLKLMRVHAKLYEPAAQPSRTRKSAQRIRDAAA